MIIELYSKRMKKERGEFPDVYQYEDIPNTFRVQIIHMIEEAFKRSDGSLTDNAEHLIKYINKVLCREYGVFKLARKYDEGFSELANFVLQTTEYEKVLDVIELIFRIIDKSFRDNLFDYNRNLNIDTLLEELNQRFKEAGLGYQYESGELIRVDSQFIHSEAVKPVLNLLKARKYDAVNQEFL